MFQSASKKGQLQHLLSTEVIPYSYDGYWRNSCLDAEGISDINRKIIIRCIEVQTFIVVKKFFLEHYSQLDTLADIDSATN
jgi:hypothetical protein